MSAVTVELLPAERFPLRPQSGLTTISCRLRSGRRFVDQDRFFQVGVGMDAADEARKEVDLVEIGANWYVDVSAADDVHKESAQQPWLCQPRDIEQMWRDEFDWVYREMDYGIFPITIHPDVSGRPQVLLMLERMFGHINAHAGVRWMTMEEIAEDFRRRQPLRETDRERIRRRRYWRRRAPELWFFQPVGRLRQCGASKARHCLASRLISW